MTENSINQSKGEIIIYDDAGGPAIEVNFDQETVWLTQADMAKLFQKDVRTISLHIGNVYKESELLAQKTSFKQANSSKTGIGPDKPTIYYNLDVIISVGYRVKSKRGTQFRIWATSRLRDYLLKGYAVNSQRVKENSNAKLKELETAVRLLQTAIETKRLVGYEKELLQIITDYTKTWVLLNQYDENALAESGANKKIIYALDYENIKKSIERFRARLMKEKQASDLFGKEVGEKLAAVLGNIEQTFDGKVLYASVEERAAHLLYFAIKDHPFTDGNKRIGSLLFLLYLVENHHVYNRRGERIVSDNMLTALALLIAESKPDHKEVMVKLVVNLLAKQ